MSMPDTNQRAARLPRWGFSVAIVLLVLGMYPYSPDPANDIKWLILSVAAFFLAGLYATSSKSADVTRGVSPLVVIAIAFATLQVIASANSGYPGYSAIWAERFVVLALLCWLASHVFRSVQHIRHFFISVCAAVALASMYGLCQRAGWDPFPWDDLQRQLEEYTNLPATFGNPNFAGHVLVLCIIMACYLALNRRMFWCLGFVPLYLVHLRFTHERAGFVALAAAGILVLTARGLSKWGATRPLRAIVTTWLIAALIAVTGIACLLVALYVKTGFAYPHDESLLLRYNSVQSASRMIATRPLQGLGPGNYVIENTPFWTPFEQQWYAAERQLTTHVHCDVLESAVDGGVLGAALYLALVLSTASSCLWFAYSGSTPDLRRLGYCGAAFAVAFATDGLFGFNLRVPVSAALLFVTIGGIDGVIRNVASRNSVRRLNLHALTRMCAIGAGTLALVVESLQFGSQCFLQRGRGALAWKSYPDAAHNFELGARIAPWSWDFPFEQGRAAQAQGDTDTARKNFMRAIEHNPNYVPAWISLAALDLQAASAAAAGANRTAAEEQALADANHVLELCPTSPEAHDIQGRIYTARAEQSENTPDTGQTFASWKQAAVSFKAALKQAGKLQVDAYDRLAKAQHQSADVVGAEIMHVRAVDSDPANQSYWDSFMDFAHETGRYDKLRYALERHGEELYGAQLNNRNDEQEREYISLQRRLAQVVDEGFTDPDGAEQIFRRCVNRAPAQPDAWDAYARFADKEARETLFKLAVRDAIATSEKEGKTPLPAQKAAALVWSSEPSGLESAAAILADGAKTLPTGDWPLRVSMGWAVDLVANRIHAAPDAVAATITANLGMVYARMEEWPDAEAMLSASYDRLSGVERGRILPIFCDVLVHSKAYDRAVALLRDAAKRFPDNIDVEWSLARTLAVAGRAAEARVEYRLLLNRGIPEGPIRNSVEAELAALKGA